MIADFQLKGVTLPDAYCGYCGRSWPLSSTPPKVRLPYREPDEPEGAGA